MTPPRYPLFPLLQTRQHQVEQARLQMSEAMAALEEIRRLEAEMTATIETIERQREQERRALEQRIESGTVEIGDVQLAQERFRGLQQDQASARSHQAQIRENVRLAEEAVQRFQKALEDRLAHREAIEKDKLRWEQERAKRQERKEWDELEPSIAHRRNKND